MNTQSSAVPDSPMESRVVAVPRMSPTQPLIWSVRRELWKYRSIYIAPLAVGAVYLFAFLLSTIAGKWERILRLDPSLPANKLLEPYMFSSLLIMGTTFLVAIFFCLDALHDERSDRSILFWKSLPVSDTTTVLAKAAIPLVVLPIVTFVITVSLHFMMMVLSSAVLLASGHNPLELWTRLPIFQMWMSILYHLVCIHSLWYAPMYAWGILVSAWARRAAFLWAGLPILTVVFIGKLVFNTWHVLRLFGYRISGPETAKAAMHEGMGQLAMVDLGTFLSTPGLWIGLLVAAGFLYGAIQLRRTQGPL